MKNTLKLTHWYMAVAMIIALQQNIVAQVGTEIKNPLLQAWSNDYGGFPPFDKIRITDFRPAFQQAIIAKEAVVEWIATNPASPDFNNTILALDTCGMQLDLINRIFTIWNTNLNSIEVKAIGSDILKMISAMEDRINQDDRIFRRVEQVYNNRKKAALTAEQQRLTEIYYAGYINSGAGLPADRKALVAALNAQLIILQNQFYENVLADESEMFVEVMDSLELAGLNDEQLLAFSQAARSKKNKAAWIILNRESQVDLILNAATNRKLREKVWRMYKSRGSGLNNEIADEILKLRIRRSQMLGYETYSQWRLPGTMMKTKENIYALLSPLWNAVQKTSRSELDTLQTLANADKIVLQPWDIAYYAEKLRKLKYDFNQNDIREYLTLENMQNGMFWVAEKLFGYRFDEVIDIPVYHPDVRVWKVTDTTTGKFTGLFYFDPFARDGKRSGYWMAPYRKRQRGTVEVTPIVSINCSFMKPENGAPALLTWRQTELLFHEFGHALNILCSRASYPFKKQEYVADFVEFPSQLLENWVGTDEVIDKFALHYQTHTPMPTALVNKMQLSTNIGQKIYREKMLANQLVDLELHINKDTSAKLPELLNRFKTKYQFNELVGFRHEPCHFLHIFDGESNSSTYYSYTWSLVMADDAFSAFTEAGGPYNQSVAKSYRKNILSISNTLDPQEAFRNFRGRDPDLKAFMKRRIQ